MLKQTVPHGNQPTGRNARHARKPTAALVTIITVSLLLLALHVFRYDVASCDQRGYCTAFDRLTRHTVQVGPEGILR
jgi:hypothetical protein